MTGQGRVVNIQGKIRLFLDFLILLHFFVLEQKLQSMFHLQTRYNHLQKYQKVLILELLEILDHQFSRFAHMVMVLDPPPRRLDVSESKVDEEACWRGTGGNGYSDKVRISNRYG